MPRFEILVSSIDGQTEHRAFIGSADEVAREVEVPVTLIAGMVVNAALRFSSRPTGTRVRRIK